MTAHFVPAADLIAEWQADVLSGKPPTLYPGGEGDLGRIEIGPGLVTLLGGPPGVGKSAFVMQLVIDALRLTPTLRALVANVEMAPAALLDRQLARLSGVDLRTIRYRKLGAEHADRIAAGLRALVELGTRLAFARPPWTVENVARAGDASGADLIVMDYIQRFTAPGEQSHKKAAVDAVMEYVRGMADCGVAVLVIAAVGRQRDDKGRSGYGGLNLASFRESSELEYGADDAFLLVRDSPDDPTGITLKHVKSRHGESLDIPLRFTGHVQRFDPVGDTPDDGPLAAAVRNIWGQQAGEAEGGDW
ncbi:DnaB-like helicase C-terminal domain-containing protein [Fimbriiglobus ruber]|uniref:Replicative DNA helicase n=1 Tax=Fimbriiglobus ruber TaxID=1908690 RepID=A0A225DY50_9BACT|nr:DnaB-like helicase C-terminal domain-containing protein [Fimbriiglobus ruber]OWK41275.1 Replicative DNA helicase [Fimbriiglobus ruber]